MCVLRQQQVRAAKRGTEIAAQRGRSRIGATGRTSPTCSSLEKVRNAIVPGLSEDERQRRVEPEVLGDESTEHLPVPPAKRIHGCSWRGEHLDRAGEGEPQGCPERQEEHDPDLRLTDDEAPGDRRREPADRTTSIGCGCRRARSSRPATRRAVPSRSRPRPGTGGPLAAGMRRPTGVDSGRVRFGSRCRLLIERLAGIEPRAGFVVGVDICQRVGGQVEHQDVRADQGTDTVPARRQSDRPSANPAIRSNDNRIYASHDRHGVAPCDLKARRPKTPLLFAPDD